jgi:hypothetical protein
VYEEALAHGGAVAPKEKTNKLVNYNPMSHFVRSEILDTLWNKTAVNPARAFTKCILQQALQSN